jgi:putative hemolysin
MTFIYAILGLFAVTGPLLVLSYLDRIYRELGHLSTAQVRRHLEIFESEIEPRLRCSRHRASVSFSFLLRSCLVFVVLTVAVAGRIYLPHEWASALECILFLAAEIVVVMHFFPLLLLVRTEGRWLIPILPALRGSLWLVWPIAASLDLFSSLLHLSEEPEESRPSADQQAIEALVGAATEEGLIEDEQARLIEQVVEFTDKRVRAVMTPRPDIIAIAASATLEDLRHRLVETKFSRLPVYEKSLDDIIGIAFARDILEVPERDSARRTVRELVRPALFVPETKLGSDLLKEMQRKQQQMAIVIDEYGSTAGIVTVEDLIEEIVGEIGEEDRRPAPDVVREPSGGYVVRGSVSPDKVQELFGLDWNAEAATIAGFVTGLAGHVPVSGEIVDHDGLRFEVLEANQRKVLRLRVRRRPEETAAPASAPVTP